MVAKGEPQEYGEPFKVGQGIESEDISPVPSPSGDLLAAVVTSKAYSDVALANIPKRLMMRNLTSGYTSKYEYPIVQMLTIGPAMAPAGAFTPRGSTVPPFAKH